MKRKLTVGVLVSIVFGFSVSPAQAIEEGEPALGSGYVVPIIFERAPAGSPSQGGSCTGAIVTSTVIATAGHCVLDKNGTISSRILVGSPGSVNRPSLSWSKVEKVYVDENYQGSGLSGEVGNSDIAFLLLSEPLRGASNVQLASENSFTSLKQSNAKVRIIGYGATNDNAETSSEEPRIFETALQTIPTRDPNSSVTSSIKGRTCSGDSGAPVLSVAPNKVTLIGIVTGGFYSNKCARKESDGRYLTFFTAINRYTNLVTEAISDSLKITQESQNSISQNRDEIESDLQSEIESLSTDLEETKSALDNALKEISELKLAISAFNKTGFKSVVCVKGENSRVVAGKSPVCPKGFKKKTA